MVSLTASLLWIRGLGDNERLCFFFCPGKERRKPGPPRFLGSRPKEDLPSVDAPVLLELSSLPGVSKRVNRWSPPAGQAGGPWRKSTCPS